MTMFKKNGGFTLVELIVVIAILAILAGVAVPAYTGYIAKAQQSADMQVLSVINTAVQGLAIAEGEVVASITVAKSASADAGYTVTISTTPGTNTVAASEVYALTGAVSFHEDFVSASWGIDPTSKTGKWTTVYGN